MAGEEQQEKYTCIFSFLAALYSSFQEQKTRLTSVLHMHEPCNFCQTNLLRKYARDNFAVCLALKISLRL